MKKKKESSMSRLMELAGNHKYFSYAAVALAAVSAVLALMPFICIWRIIREIIQLGGDYQAAAHIAGYGWQAVGFSLLAMAFYIGSLMCSHKAAFRVQVNLRVKLMEHIMKLPIGYVESQGTGKIKKIVFDSTGATETFLAHNLPDKVVSKVTPIALLIIMFAYDWKLGMICLIPVAFAFLIMGTMMMGAKMAEDMKQYQNALETMSSEAVEYIRGIPVVKTFGQSVFSFKRFKHAIDAYEKWTLDYTNAMMIPMLGFTTFSNAIFAALTAAVFLLGKGGLTDSLILSILFFILISAVLTTTLMKVAYAGESQIQVEDALKRMDEILDIEPLSTVGERADIEDASVKISDICFSYEKDKEAISHISLDIAAGQHIALVGPSGGGKTSLASLIARFWDVDAGSILIGGVNVKEIPTDQLMDTVSYVFQDSRLLKTSIMENVRMGRPQAADEEVLEALKAAMCTDILEKLPQGVHTVIGAKGTYVSGGEMQRIAIARAFLKNAPILILDEATAFADPDNEIMVQQAFENLAKDKTVIMIAHRLSTIINADKIFVLKDGAIAEEGSHRQLLEQNGIYSHMWSEYNKSVDWQVRKAGA